MQYIRNTKALTLAIQPIWVDSSYAVHLDMRSHTGVVMSLVKGAMYSMSTKQKLNTKSSMEAELLAIDNAMAQVLWTRCFLVAQGEYVPTMTIYQDNKSTKILLAENGKQSSSWRTRHLNILFLCYRQDQKR
jgi:hypothetical protein